MLSRIFWFVGVKGDYRRVFWRYAVARLIRGEVLGVRTRPFVDAATALGVPSQRLLWRHLRRLQRSLVSER